MSGKLERRDFIDEDVFELGDVLADAFLAGLIPGTLRFSRAVLGAGYRRVAEPLPEFQPVILISDRIHYFTIGASEIRTGRFGWQCSCTQVAKHAYVDPVSAFGNAVAHVPAGHGWRAKGENGE